MCSFSVHLKTLSDYILYDNLIVSLHNDFNNNIYILFIYIDLNKSYRKPYKKWWTLTLKKSFEPYGKFEKYFIRKNLPKEKLFCLITERDTLWSLTFFKLKLVIRTVKIIYMRKVITIHKKFPIYTMGFSRKSRK